MQNNCMWVIVTGKHKKTFLASSFIILVETGTEHLKFSLSNFKPMGIMDCSHNFTKCPSLRYTVLLSPQKSSYFLLASPLTSSFYMADAIFPPLMTQWGLLFLLSWSEELFATLLGKKGNQGSYRPWRKLHTPTPHSGMSLRTISLQGARWFIYPSLVLPPASPTSPECLHVAPSSFPHSQHHYEISKFGAQFQSN